MKKVLLTVSSHMNSLTDNVAQEWNVANINFIHSFGVVSNDELSSVFIKVELIIFLDYTFIHSPKDWLNSIFNWAGDTSILMNHRMLLDRDTVKVWGFYKRKGYNRSIVTKYFCNLAVMNLPTKVTLTGYVFSSPYALATHVNSPESETVIFFVNVNALLP